MLQLNLGNINWLPHGKYPEKKILAQESNPQPSAYMADAWNP